MVRPIPRIAQILLLAAAALALGLYAALSFFQAPAAQAQETPVTSVNITTDQAAVYEGGLAMFTVKRSGGSLVEPLTVRIRSWEPNQVQGGTNVSEQMHQVTIKPGRNSVSLEIIARVDIYADPLPGSTDYLPHTLIAEVHLHPKSGWGMPLRSH